MNRATPLDACDTSFASPLDSSALVTVTGINAVDDSVSSPRSIARRHLKTWFAFTRALAPLQLNWNQASMSTAQSAASLKANATGELDAPHSLLPHQPWTNLRPVTT